MNKSNVLILNISRSLPENLLNTHSFPLPTGHQHPPFNTIPSLKPITFIKKNCQLINFAKSISHLWEWMSSQRFHNFFLGRSNTITLVRERVTVKEKIYFLKTEISIIIKNNENTFDSFYFILNKCIFFVLLMTKENKQNFLHTHTYLL